MNKNKLKINAKIYIFFYILIINGFFNIAKTERYK